MSISSDEITISQRTELPEQSPRPPIILLVEDNADLRQYIFRSMEQSYRIMEAENGEEGLNMAIKEIPDLIISDVMMPKMDGFEFCAKIKTDQRTSHIPLILLTARATREDKIEGLETGADDYLSKPFDVNELLVRVKNLIEQRRKLRERFSREIFLGPEAIAVSSADEVFLKKAIAITQKHLTEPEFNVNKFSNEIGFSRSQLHRKMLGLTNLVPNHFIRILRLHHAKQLLDKKVATVSEIAYESGFSNLSYFARCFKEQFGQSPSDYGKK
ncbi:MAG: response regulator [Deltaproteobacteria bacterium]|nr:response regulator [Deltaproteobacteria bacterium]